tara:strand:+ start:1546 stop:1893 length:348 start_codon:yes stop_codon:yes gene_type:complete
MESDTAAMGSWSPPSRLFLQEVESSFDNYRRITRNTRQGDENRTRSTRQGDENMQEMLNTRIGIGKYADNTIKYVINCDISYIGWILNNKDISAEQDGGGLSRVKYIIKYVLKNA